MGKEVKPLEYHADFLANIVDALGIAHADAVYNDFTCRRLFQVINAAKNRTFAGTGRSDNDDYFFIVNSKVNSF